MDKELTIRLLEEELNVLKDVIENVDMPLAVTKPIYEKIVNALKINNQGRDNRQVRKYNRYNRRT
jgi:hypothetical protein